MAVTVYNVRSFDASDTGAKKGESPAIPRLRSVPIEIEWENNDQ